MATRIEDYAVLGNCETMALVGRDGSIDWLGFPRFDSAACFSALLGDARNGRWLLAPTDSPVRVTRCYRGDTMILETTFETQAGAACIIDFMTRREGASDLVRIVKGLRGKVAMHTELIVRFDYGSVVPWVSRRDDGRREIIAGPDRLLLAADTPLRGVDFRTVGKFEVEAGDEIGFTLTWSRSYCAAPETPSVREALVSAESFWRKWSEHFKPGPEWSKAVIRSLLTLKALSHRETGGIVAAGTTSLPEKIGGSRNWDYRYCWLRDATFTLYALLGAGFVEEARAWRGWLLRAVAGSPEDLQIMYGIAGERRLDEYEVPWLKGYEASSPVRIGNAAAKQIQLDVYGEILDAFYVARKAGLRGNAASWALECALVEHLESIWDKPDDGIWEVRGGRKHFTYSKVMAWVAFDRVIRSVEEFGMDGPVAHWRAIRDAIHSQVCEKGFDPAQNSFVQFYGSRSLDASLLLIAMVGFLPPSDSRIRGTLTAIEKGLIREGFVQRYHTSDGADGLPPGEGVFLACSFWLADNYILQGRFGEARTLFEKLLSLRNDVGLLAEEYDPSERRQLGNFPQAFSHLALINTAHNLMSADGAVHQRSRQ
ncbi:MAG: glycoside hydrolase family 15 protein [Bradyrhizobium sp.]|jgi:GH15 family glucan-1,4-alpha-glucosidase